MMQPLAVWPPPKVFKSEEKGYLLLGVNVRNDSAPIGRYDTEEQARMTADQLMKDGQYRKIYVLPLAATFFTEEQS